MENLPNNPLIEFHADTLHAVRKIYNLDQPGAINEAIDTFEAWIQKQNHFTKKDFDRDYLERTIIRSKGSVERAKEHLDKTCTSRTLVPHFFLKCDVRDPIIANAVEAFMPKLTDDYYRVYMAYNSIQEYTSELFTAFYKRWAYRMEYICAHDYACGLIMVLDFRNTNLLEFVKHMHIGDFAHAFNLVLGGYGFRLKGLYLMTSSKFVDSFVSILKQVLSAKIGQRIRVMHHVEDLYEYIDKKLLPKEYGGEELSLKEQHEKWLNVLGSEDYDKYLTNIYEAKTIEKLRLKDGSADDQLGIAGTFRTLKVD
ncbi:unnamed protein product [Chilo suppressalis]|uniref:CRAL-TRIO domain-containing protein n=1 Tax=Chilo suppressalis TaxID=168631 RepID=A0ABN8L8M9_CHISP|nr:unnamed protein product [Chilo suppressalis]